MPLPKSFSVYSGNQDYLVRLDWDDNVIFPQQAVQNNLYALKKAMGYLEKGEIAPALEAFTVLTTTVMPFSLSRKSFIILQNIS